MNRFLISLAVLLVGSCLLPSQDRKKISVEKGYEAVTRFSAKIPGAPTGQIITINDDSVEYVFPSDHFYVLQFRQYPVAPALPESLTYNNLFVVNAEDNVELIRDTNALEALFRAKLHAVKNEAQALNAVKAWLRLTEEFYQDGFFEFSIPSEALVVVRTKDGLKASGKTIVTSDGGGNGEIAVSISFDAVGRLKKVNEVGNIVAGRRPNF